MLSYSSTKSITGNEVGRRASGTTSVVLRNVHLNGPTAPGVIATVSVYSLASKYTVSVRGVIIDGGDTHFVDELKLVSAQSLVEGGTGMVSSILMYSLTRNNLVLTINQPTSLFVQVSLSIIVRDVEAGSDFTIISHPSLTRTSLP